MKFQSEHPVPATKRLTLELEKQIVSGKLKPGTQLLSIRRLAAERNVDISSVFGAYRQLEKKNLVVREHGRGCYVADPVRKNIVPGRRIYGFPESLFGTEELYPDSVNRFDFGAYENYPRYFDFLKEKTEKKPGLIMVDESMLPAMAEEGILRPLDEFLAGYGFADVLSLIDPVCKRTFMYRSGTFALPVFCSPAMAYFNRKLFQDAGVALPDEAWSWNDLFDLLDKFTLFSNEGRFERGALGLLLDPNGCMPMISQFGGELFDRNHNCVIGSEAFFKGVSFCEKVLRHLGCCVHHLGDKREALGRLFADGALAFVIGSESDAFPARKKIPPENFYELPLPGSSQGLHTSFSATAIGLPAGEYDPSELLFFLKQLYTAEHLAFIAERACKLTVLNDGLTESCRRARSLGQPVKQSPSRKAAGKVTPIFLRLFSRIPVTAQELKDAESRINSELRSNE